jgi:SAM-dependent methyltransferase
MHKSSIENMGRCIRKYLDPRPWPGRKWVVVDIGSTNVNGSYRELFDPARYDYIGVDLAAGPGVDLVIADPYRIPLVSGGADVVISGQMLEHNEFFWLTFQEKMRLLQDDGFVFMIAPSRGQIHRYPVDCYRFYPDGYAALAKLTNSVLVDCWLDDNHWGDLVGVFRKSYDRAYGKFDVSRLNTWQPASALDVAAPPPGPWNGQHGSDDEERLGGSTPYKDVLKRLHTELAPALYLEIGVRTGASLALAQGEAIGVDPAPILSVELPAKARVITATSDSFFETWQPAQPVALGFVDGLHLFEQALRDFMHLERVSDPHGVIVIDDIYPNHPHQACRQRRTRAWTGDLWKLHEVLRQRRPDLTLLPLDTHPTGLLMVFGLDPQSTVLSEAYDAMVTEYAREIAPPPHVLGRADAQAPKGQVLTAVLRHLAQTRDEGRQVGGASTVAPAQVAPVDRLP